MAEDVIVVLDLAAIDAVMDDPGFADELLNQARPIVTTARGLAPVRRSGSRGGAASIQATAVHEDVGWTAHVTWDDAHSYMRFQDRGTRYVTARRFLERAADGF